MHRIPSVPFRPLLAAALLTLAACGGGGDGGSTNPSDAALVDLSTSTMTFNAIGATQQVTVTVRDSKGATISSPVTWSSQNSTIAEVTANGTVGTVTARSPGSTVIRATSGGAQTTMNVTVLGVRAIALTPSAASIRVGDTQGLVPNLTADAGVSTAVRWSSDNALIAAVSSAGVVTGVSPGVANIRATAVADDRFSASAQITVAPFRGVLVTPAALSLGTQEQRPLQVSVSLENGLSTAVTWQSSATNVATVNNQGVVTGVAIGTATITAISVSDPALRGSITVSVVPIVRSVALSPTSATMFINGAQPLVATVTADVGATRTLNWSSSDPTIATINSSSGVVTAVAHGQATITASAVSDPTRRATATISVVPRPLSVSIVQRNVGLNPGQTTQLTAAVGADPGFATGVTWSSGTPAVATVNAQGFVTAVGVGSTLVTAASVVDASKLDTVTVTVIPRLASTWSASRLGGVLYEDVLSMQTFEGGPTYGVNLVGDIFRYENAAWSRVLQGSTFGTQFTALHGATMSNIVAVGTNGVIVRFDGTSWTRMTSPTTRTLTSVWVEGVNSAFAVGDNGTAIRYSPAGWATTATGVTDRLNGVWANNGVAYAVGNAGAMLRFFNGAWVRAEPVTAEDLYAVAGFSGLNVLAAGSFGTLVRFDGTTWSILPGSGVAVDLFAIAPAAVAAAGFTVAGDGVLLRVTGTNVARIELPYAARMTSASMDISGNLWVGGQRGMVIRHDGSRWETLNLSPDLIDAWSTAPNNTWAVGEFGFVYRWNGGTWSRQLTPTTATLNAVWGTGLDVAFAGGDNGVMLRYDGTSWTTMQLPSTASVFAMWGTSATNVYAVTSAGQVLRYNGTAWSVVSTSPRALWAIYGVSANDIYASGEGGTVLRYNGTSWSPLPAGANGTLAGLWMTGGNNVFSVGADGTGSAGVAYGFNGTGWSNLTVGTSRVLTSVWGPSVTDVFATGDLGTLVRFNGVSWQNVPTGTTDLLWSITGAPNASGGGFAVGYNSTVVAGLNSNGEPAGLRVGATIDLDPSPRARADARGRKPVPTGEARRNRKTPAAASAARELPASKKYR